MGNEIETLSELLKKPTPQIIWTVTGFTILFFFFGQPFLKNYGIHFQIILSYGVGLSQLTINRFLTGLILKIRREHPHDYELFSALNCTITIFLIGVCYISTNIFGLYDYNAPIKVFTLLSAPFILYLFDREFSTRTRCKYPCMHFSRDV